MHHILGVDLAWGYKNPDGICSISIKSGKARLEQIGLSKGDSQLTEWIQNYVNQGSVLAMFDAPWFAVTKLGHGQLIGLHIVSSENIRLVVIR